MLPGISGTLVSADFLERLLSERFDGRLGEDERDGAGARVGRWWRSSASQCGPASSTRSIVATAALPLVRALGFDVLHVAMDAEPCVVTLSAGGSLLPLLVISWQASPDAFWRIAVRHGLLHGSPWCLVYGGCGLRILDVVRADARRHLEFDLPVALAHDQAWRVAHGLLRSAAFARSPSTPDLMSAVVSASEEEGTHVCSALRSGVLRGIEHMLGALAADAARRRAGLDAVQLHDEALTAVYRMLFLLFAEARTLVPSWHPTYRRAYSLEVLRGAADGRHSAAGLWEALQAIARLAYAGCHAGDLTVTAFNGRLFSPARAPRLEHWQLDDEAVRQTLMSVSTVAGRRGAGRQRIAFSDLGVEELGAVYEGLLEYTPIIGHPSGAGGSRRPQVIARLERTGAARRKATGTFYTPRTLTQFLVRATLEPLVRGRTAGQLLELRICDPAMGSGAFLVAACRYLAQAYETALLGEGSLAATDVGEPERAGFRRVVAQRCLYGVDINPMAVQLARLSLWLTTLAADLPLTFLDHHLVAGDSLIGAGPLDLLRGGPAAPADQLPLFDPDEFATMVLGVLPVRLRLERTADADAATVREKETALAALDVRGDLARWRTACDVWCANWCDDRPVRGGTLRALLQGVLRDGGGGGGAAGRYVACASRRATERAFHHWPLRFPEVFFDNAGGPLHDAGFDAVLGNPPWEMLRAEAHAGPRGESVALLRFARHSGLYAASSAGHTNQYQLFVDRALALTRRGGRIGLVVPGGFALDASAAGQRRRLLHECGIDVLIGFENRSGVFPIHRGTRFLLFTATRGERTGRIRCRFGLQDPSDLHELSDPAATDPEGALSVAFTPALLERLTGPDLAIPHMRCTMDLRIAERLSAVHPRLGGPGGWAARFARELNATDHRRLFTTTGRGLPVLEGKHVSPFVVRTHDVARRIPRERALAALGPAARLHRPRLAFRDVASASNRQTVIAAIVPAECVTVHTLFCLRTRLTDADQRVLCGLLNSYVVNFLARQRVTTHVTLAVMHTLPVPRPLPGSRLHARIEQQVRRLIEREASGSTAAVQALAAEAYGLTGAEFDHVLSTFPLVPEAERRAAAREYAVS